MSPMDQMPQAGDVDEQRRGEGAAGDGQGPSPASLVEHTRRIGDHATALAREVGAAISEARQFVETSARNRPYATLSAAAGAGYVLAGGLSSSLTRLAVRTGTRVAAAWVFKELAEAATGSEVKVEKADEQAGGSR